MTGLLQQKPENLSSLSSATVGTNAKFVRNFSERLLDAHEHGVDGLAGLLEYCSQQLVFSSMSSIDAEVLFPAIQTALIVPNADIRSFTLRTIVVVCQYTPVDIFRKYWQSTAQKVISVLKSVQNETDLNHHPQALVALASLVSISERIAQLGGENKASVSTICQSAVVHSTKTLEDTRSSAKIITASLSVLFSVLQVSPREMRTNASRLEGILWNRLLNHYCADVRDLSAKLHAHILTCYPEKLKAKLFDERLRNICKELDDLLEILQYFEPGNGNRKVKTGAAVKSLTFEQMQFRYAAICSSLGEALGQALPLRVPISVPTLVHTLCNGIRFREIDPFVSCPELNITANDALRFQSLVYSESMNILGAVSSYIGRSAILPYANILSQTFVKRLSKMIILSRVRQGLIAGLPERIKIYSVIRVLADTLGSSFIEIVAPLFVELFDRDVKLYISNEESRNYVVSDSSGYIPESSRSRKRRRQSREASKDVDVLSSNQDGSRGLQLVLGQQTSANISATFTTGLQVATSFFQNRGFLSSSTSVCLQKLEALLSNCSEKNSHCPALFQSLSAAVLGGGSNRTKAEACPLLLTCSRLSKRSVGSSRLREEIQSEILNTKISCEALFHPRAPPVLQQSSLGVRKREKSEDTGRGIDSSNNVMTALANWQQETTKPKEGIKVTKDEHASKLSSLPAQSTATKSNLQKLQKGDEGPADTKQQEKLSKSKEPLWKPVKSLENPIPIVSKDPSLPDPEAHGMDISNESSTPNDTQPTNYQSREKSGKTRSVVETESPEEQLKPDELPKTAEPKNSVTSNGSQQVGTVQKADLEEEAESDLIMSLRFEESEAE